MRKRRTKKHTIALKNRIISEFQNDPRPLTEIAEKFEVTRAYVSKILKEAKQAPGETLLVDVTETLEEVSELSNWSVADLATIVGVSQTALLNWADRGSRAYPKHARILELLLKGLHHAARIKRH